MERTTELRTFRVQLVCDAPGCTGIMYRTGCSIGMPRLYYFRCAVCQKIHHSQKNYPKIKYEGITDNEEIESN